MKKTLHIDERLLRNAKSACGAKTDTDTVRLGLEALVRHGAYERLRALRGSEPRARETPGDVSGLQHSITRLHDRLG
jgi:Arc/MetJ family transcription regulator